MKDIQEALDSLTQILKPGQIIHISLKMLGSINRHITFHNLRTAFLAWKLSETINDSRCKLDFINSIKEYLVQFLDNERITAVNGEKEHSKLMKEACKNLEEDLIQINNLYTLLLKEASKKITKKSYTELYNIEYLANLENKSNQYDEELKKLKLPVTVINPNYWRIDGRAELDFS